MFWNADASADYKGGVKQTLVKAEQSPARLQKIELLMHEEVIVMERRQ